MINGNQSINEMFGEIKERIDQAFTEIGSNPNEPIRHLNWL